VGGKPGDGLSAGADQSGMVPFGRQDVRIYGEIYGMGDDLG